MVSNCQSTSQGGGIYDDETHTWCNVTIAGNNAQRRTKDSCCCGESDSSKSRSDMAFLSLLAFLVVLKMAVEIVLMGKHIIGKPL